MSHVDDGILHAYLDGALDALSDAGELPHGATSADIVAHLDGCADCRARLEAERAVRQGAALVMNDLPQTSHAVTDIARYAGAQRSRRRAWIPLGWAASVILAVSLGWWGADAWRGQRGGIAMERSVAEPRATQNSAPDAAPADAAPADASLPDEMRASDGEVARADAGGARAEDNAPRQESSSGGSASPEAAASTENAAAGNVNVDAVSAAAGAAPLGVVTAFDSMSPQVAARERLPHLYGDSITRNMLAGDLELSTLAELRSKRTFSPLSHARTEPAPPAAPAFVPMSTAAGLEAADAARGTDSWTMLVSPPGSMAVFDTILAREQSGELVFTDASHAVLTADSEPLFIVADGTEPSVGAARDVNGTVVRVRQTLASGELVEIVSWQPPTITGQVPATSEQGSAEKARAAAETTPMLLLRDTVRVLPNGGRELLVHAPAARAWIAIRANLDEDDLRALARRLTIR